MLVILTVAIGAFAISFAFSSLLIQQAKASVTLTSDAIARATASADSLDFFDPTRSLDAVANTEQLDHWASTTQYVQIDNPAGNPLGKSSNMADLTLPPIPNLDDERRFSFAVDRDRTHLLVLSRILERGGKPIAVVQIAERLDIIDRETRDARRILGLVTLAAIIAVALASAFIARSAVDPIVRLTEEIAQIGSTRLQRRLRWKRLDELGTLANAFDAMLDRLEDAFAGERAFIANASHELKTPLTIISANAQLIRRRGDADPALRAESLDAIISESRRLADIVSGMLTLAKADAGDDVLTAEVDLVSIASEVVEHARAAAQHKGLRLSSDLPADAWVLGDAGLLRQMVANLVENAVKFTLVGEIRVRVSERGARVLVEISDTGIGFGEDQAEKLFDRFFRADTSHSRTVEGTGIGLALVRAIAHVHHGSVVARPRPEGGALFTVELPGLPSRTEPAATNVSLTKHQ